MTDMTPDLINMRVATWAGWTNIQQSRRHQGRIAGNAPERYELTVIPDYYHSNASMDLLGVLVERGYCPSLVYDDNGNWALTLEGMQSMALDDNTVDTQMLAYIIADQWQSTIPAAICHACLELIEREGKE